MEVIMPGEIIPIIIVPAFFFTIAYAIKVISDNRAKRTLINQNLSPDMVEKLFLERPLPDIDSALKWGLIICSIGIAFCLLQVLPFDEDEPITYGIVFLFGGASLLGYYALVSNRDTGE
jgi:hypothetical protein